MQLHRFKPTLSQFILFAMLIAFCLFGFASSAAPPAQEGTATLAEERVLEDRVPRHLPIRVKIKKEKEKAFKDLKNDKWLRDFELEITNTGDKPIYFLELLLTLPDIKSPSGYPIGFSIRYGRFDLLDFSIPLLAEDTPILPGEIYTFKIPEKDVKGWETFTSKSDLLKIKSKKVLLEFYWLNFGDGTGFRMKTGAPFPKKQSSNSSCEEQKRGSAAGNYSALLSSPSGSFSQISFSFLPASFQPVFFSPENTKNSASNGPLLQSGLCCPGTACSYRKPSSYSCECGGANTTISASCNDPLGGCSIDERIDKTCPDGNGGVYICPEFFITPCGGPVPMPTPFPTPEPMPTATPKPTPCPLVCSESYPSIPADPCTIRSLGEPACPPGYERAGNCFDYPLA